MMPQVTIYADPSLEESIHISIEDTQFRVTAGPGEFVKLPSVGGKRKVLVTYKGVETAILLNLEFDIYGGNSDRFWEEIRFSDGSVSFSVIAFGRFLRSS